MGDTPQQPTKRLSRRRRDDSSASPPSRRHLAFADGSEGRGKRGRAQGLGWSEAEDRALVEFVLSEGFEAEWPQTKKANLWEKAAKLLELRCACSRTSEWLIFTVYLLNTRHFGSISDAFTIKGLLVPYIGKCYAFVHYTSHACLQGTPVDVIFLT